MMKEVEEAIRAELNKLATEIWNKPGGSLASALEVATQTANKIKQLVNEGPGDAERTARR